MTKRQPHRALRDAFGQFATGVAVVTARNGQGGFVGMTVNSFSSVSLDPPLVLWSLGLESPSRVFFESASYYAINVLAAEQQELSQRFATPHVDKFNGISWAEGLGGAPLLPGCAAWFECRSTHHYAGGDHVILVAEVERFRAEPKPPLIFHGGRYRSLSEG
ncbi:MAG TPA: flavin reductase family protein [Rhodocyclaceae bacterium]|nr:flavin reductase family protein [Rhodocyclaceae bacterium]HNH34564.1 flavin reductase family protein [Rhodocyclaceae bacterium]